MLRDITIGQYYPTASILHKLDPRTKLFGTMCFISSLFISISYKAYILASIFLFVNIYLSKVPLKFILKGLKAIFFLLFLSISFNLFLTEGEVIFRFHIFKITKEGLIISTFMAVRLIFLIVGSSLMTLTTTPNLLTDGMEKGLGILKYIKVPVHEIAMMMSIALRFIPILTEETDKIMKAQMARGADFETGGLVKKAKAMVPLLVPLFISAFRRATDLAMAMEARCYNGSNNRTKMKELKYKKEDKISYAIIFIYMLLMILVRIYKNG